MLSRQAAALVAILPPFDPHIPITQRRQELMEKLARLGGQREPVAGVENLVIPGPGGEVRLRVYLPQAEKPHPVVVYFHGGAWALGGLESHHHNLTAMTNAAQAMFISVDYRLAPEHPFPTAVEDAYAATTWVAKYAANLDGDRSRIAVAGDSAGGNLAAAVTLIARERGGPRLLFQAHLYPAFSFAYEEKGSFREFGHLPTYGSEEARYYRHLYLPNQEDWAHPYASPLLAEDLSGLPPALIQTAEFDILRDEGEAYGRRLHEAGVPVQVTRYNGMVHPFVLLAGIFPKESEQAIMEMGAALHRAFQGTTTL